MTVAVADLALTAENAAATVAVAELALTAETFAQIIVSDLSITAEGDPTRPRKVWDGTAWRWAPRRTWDGTTWR